MRTVPTFIAATWKTSTVGWRTDPAVTRHGYPRERSLTGSADSTRTATRPCTPTWSALIANYRTAHVAPDNSCSYPGKTAGRWTGTPSPG